MVKGDVVMVDVFKALSDSCRIRLVAILLSGEFTVQELTAIIGTGQSRISHHLKSLNSAGLLSVKRQGTWSYYRISETNEFFLSILDAVKLAIERIPDRESDMAAVAGVLDARRIKSQDFFNSHARQWDELSRRLLPLPDYHKLLLQEVPAGRKLLEIGVGTGELLIQLAQISTEVVGVDHSPAMLAEAGLKVDRFKGTVELRLGEMTHLPLADSSVDCVIANMVLHHAPQPLTVIKEIKRVLRGGGLLLVADLAQHSRESARDQLADQWLGFAPDEFSGWLRSSGFDTVKISVVAADIGQEAVLIICATNNTKEM